MPRSNSTRHLTTFLLKATVKKPDDAIKEPSSLDHHKLKAGLGTGTLYVQRQRPKVPAWVGFIGQHVDPTLGQLLTASTSAVLIIRAKKRLFAFIFGFGRFLVKPEAIEPDFGLRATLNTVDPETLKSVDMKTFQDLTLHTTRQSSRGSPLETFGLDIAQDILRAVTGEPKDQTLARRLTGSDALAVNVPVEVAGLSELCGRLLAASADTAYKDRFGWIDDLRAISDPTLIDELNVSLVDAVNDRNSDAVQIGPPEPVQWENVNAFRYSISGDDADYPDLDSRDYIGELLDDVTLDDLKRHKILVLRSDSEHPSAEWPVYKCLLYETVRNGIRYVLTTGRWYAVSETLAGDIEKQIKLLVKNAPTLPNATTGEIEDAYNARVTAGGNKFVNMHRLMIKGTGFRAPVELCDIFTSDRQFVHVKPWASSSTLSHMVAQGITSAEAFLWDSTFKKDAAQKLASVNASARHLLETGSVPHEFEVVYAIMIKARATWPTHLPFFSQLHLTQAAERLRRLGYKVSLTRIEIA